MAKIKVVVEIQDAFDVQEAAKQLNIGIATAWRWIRISKLASFSLEGRTLVPGDSIRTIQKERAAAVAALSGSQPTQKPQEEVKT